MKISLLQCNSISGGVDVNAATLFDAVCQAHQDGAELCIAPELGICGPYVQDMLLSDGFIHECMSATKELAEKLHSKGLPPLLVGAPFFNSEHPGTCVNGALLLHDGEVTVAGVKCSLQSAGIWDEHRYVQAGDSISAITIGGKRFAIVLGDDIWEEGSYFAARPYGIPYLARAMRTLVVDAVISMSALPYAQGILGAYESVVAQCARKYGVPVVAVNAVGGHDEIVCFGGSMIAGSDGTCHARCEVFEDAVLTSTLLRQSNAEICIPPAIQPEEELWLAMIRATRDFAAKTGFTRAVFGLSGGIDSALIAVIAAKVFGSHNVTGILLPSPYSSRGSIDDSLELAATLGIETHTVTIEMALQEYDRMFSAAFSEPLEGLARENIQSRIRGAFLMAHSNAFGALLLTTSNKSEAAVGYCTLYGDMSGGLGIIGDLYKTQVYDVCRWINDQWPGCIPQVIIEKEPSAELSAGQKDSDSLPDYTVLDALLVDLLEKRHTAKELIELGYDASIVQRVTSLVSRSEFKRSQAPAYIQLSRVGFGRSWRMPVVRKIA